MPILRNYDTDSTPSHYRTDDDVYDGAKAEVRQRNLVAVFVIVAAVVVVVPVMMPQRPADDSILLPISMRDVVVVVVIAVARIVSSHCYYR